MCIGPLSLHGYTYDSRDDTCRLGSDPDSLFCLDFLAFFFFRTSEPARFCIGNEREHVAMRLVVVV